MARILPSQVASAIDSMFGPGRNEIDSRALSYNYRAEVHALLGLAQTKRAEGDKSAHAALRNPQYSDVLLRLASWVDGQFGSDARPTLVGKWKPDVLATPAPGFAAEVMRAYHAKVRKLGKKIRKLDAAGLHRLRIRIKKLRYATEFLGGLWPTGERNAIFPR